MRNHVIRAAALGAAAFGAALLPAGVAAADNATPSPGATTVTTAGTSFLTATVVNPGQPVRVSASTGDYLYWSFNATAGQVNDVSITVTLPPAKSRHGGSVWAVEVFDGLRRRQACTAGAQTPMAAPDAASVTLGCTLRRVRPWAEPWSGDPLPGTYYVRLSVTTLPEEDRGLPTEVEMLIGSDGNSGSAPEDGDLKAPLVPAAKPGKVLAADAATATAEQSGEEDGGWFDGWFDGFSSRWIWTSVGGILAAVGGVVGFALTRRPRHRSVG
ncbi:peptidase [Micromonospora sp. NPDC049559]|uniref:peptidase n=1 Tax=Micromonospora sp. NPDC049559 TaxID=3155923 RepID=UPI00343234B6